MATGDLAQNVIDKQQAETGNSAEKDTMRNLTDPIEDWGTDGGTTYGNYKIEYNSTDDSLDFNYIG